MEGYQSAKRGEHVVRGRIAKFEVGESRDRRMGDRAEHLINEEQIKYLLGEKSVCSPFEQRILRLLRNGWSMDNIAEHLKVDRRTVSNSLYRVRRKKEQLDLDPEPEGSFDNMA